MATPATGKSLVIVESPAKAATIGRYLGKDFKVESSVGHIRDLPKTKLGVDIENDFEPTYVPIRGKKKVIDQLRKSAAACKNVYLAPDPDREGEAIAWHIAKAIEGKNSNVFRVTFNEITKRAVQEAIEQPSEINYNLVNAQQARRVLDRLVGYQISPLLWKKVQKGLSAGRVQSVAVRMICEREQEIKAFQPVEYWSIEALVEKPGAEPEFTMKLAQIDGKKFEIGNEADAKAVVEAATNESFRVDKVIAKKTTRKPYAPFITSTLQQEASRKLHFTARATMAVAQQLYEGVEMGSEGPQGLITYMRTDSTRISNEAQEAARKLIGEKYGADYVPEKPNVFASKKGAQDAHEAVRPTSMEFTPEAMAKFLDARQLKLYKIIWNRFLASQMSPAKIDQTRVESRLCNGKYTFVATGSVITFPGFLAAYEESKDETTDEKDSAESKLPSLAEGDALNRKKIDPIQHFTQPPPRYSESSLVKELEAQGIGRPSTYAQIIQTIQDRDYVIKEKSRFYPTERGDIVTEILKESFPEIMDMKFTAQMEDRLDNVEDGTVDWVKLMHDFYTPFSERLESAATNMRDVKKEVVETDIDCDKCGAMMVVRWGRNGRFLACSAYPECKNPKSCEFDEDGKARIAESTPEEDAKREIIETDIKCEKCDSMMIVRWGRNGRFLACSGFPKCKNAKECKVNEDGSVEVVKQIVSDEKCEKCGSDMIVKNGRRGKFLACSAFPKCRNAQPLKIGVKCPEEDCDGDLVERKLKSGETIYGCSEKKCKFFVLDRPREQRCEACDKAVKVVGKIGEEQVFGCTEAKCPFE